MVRFLSNPLILKFSVDIPVLVKLKSFFKKKQVIDLEGLANHRGSAFGGIDLPPQQRSNLKTICFP
jgi:hypothetical protein